MLCPEAHHELLLIVSVLLWGGTDRVWLCDFYVQLCPEVQQGQVLAQRRGLQGWACDGDLLETA